MAREVIIHNLKDWSTISDKSDCWKKLDFVHTESNFGIHIYNSEVWTAGFVGVGRIYDSYQKPIQSKGREHVVVISSSYHMDPWPMLETVMADDEYDNYLEEINSSGDFLFKIFYDQPLVRLAQDQLNDGDILYTLSFINSCYNLCRKGLKKEMYYHEENFTSKVRGKIVVSRNINCNTFHGRNDRFYCKYIDFTDDSIENRILKATLHRCKSILATRFQENTEIQNQIAFCLNTLRHVKETKIKLSDFNNATASGLYMYYKPTLQQAKCIYSQKYYAYAAESGKTIAKSTFTIPYMINMETLFEFYSRAMIKKRLDTQKYRLEAYSKRLYLQRGVTKDADAEKGIHLIPHVIPDIIIYDRATNTPAAVIDVKYKEHSRAVREDSHQLLSYVLLTGAPRCGFVFPGEGDSMIVPMKTSGQNYLDLRARGLKYFELLLGKKLESGELEKALL